MTSADTNQLLREHSTLGSVLRDIDTRFILNLDEALLEDPAMIFFKIQKAHWYYCDRHDAAIKSRHLPYISLEKFGRVLVETSALLSRYLPAHKREHLFDDWRDYMRRIPRMGAIVLNPTMDSVLMVTPYGRKHIWQFPRGKLNSEESHEAAAAREVMEECGVDVCHLIKPDRFIERKIDGTVHKLFIAFPLSESVPLATKTKKEIEAIEWIPVRELPGGSDEHRKFFAVSPFVDALRNWIFKQKAVRSDFDDDESFREGEEVPAAKADLVNEDTFGVSSGGWSFEAMIQANRKLGYKSDLDNQTETKSEEQIIKKTVKVPPVKILNRKADVLSISAQTWHPNMDEILAAFDKAWRKGTVIR